MVKPILFNTDMVRAILDGRKTQTRRIMKPQPILENRLWKLGDAGWSDNIKGFHPVPCHSLFNRVPYQPGDILYVRETWMNPCEELCRNDTECDGCIYGKGYRYKADYRIDDSIEKWHPSIHMPKEAARIWLRVTDVRVERLQEITSTQICQEGVEVEIPYSLYPLSEEEKRYAFSQLWNSIVKKSDLDRYGWAADPWVWVIEFERIEKPS
jgi:hypothetical protein